jgi:transcription elongation factor Elf1
MARKGRKRRYFKTMLEKALTKPPKYDQCPVCNQRQAVGTLQDHSGEVEIACKFCKVNYKTLNRHDLYTPYDATHDWVESTYLKEHSALRGITLPDGYERSMPKVLMPSADVKLEDGIPQRKRVQVGLPPCTVGMKFLSLGDSLELAHKAKTAHGHGERMALPHNGVAKVGKLTHVKKMELEDYARIPGVVGMVRTRILYNVNNTKKILKRNGKENGREGPKIESVYTQPKVSPARRKSQEPAARKERHIRI